ncbi:MAG: nucleotide exchange factor GrpE [Bacillota bacterium]
MSNKQSKQEEIEIDEEIVVPSEEETSEAPKLDLDFDYGKIDFESLDNEKKKEVFEKLTSQNLMVLNILKEMDIKIKDLEAKSVSRVSEEQFQRLLADFENYKKRNEATRSTAYQDGKLDILKELLNLLDSFERGISMVTDENSKKAMEMMQKTCTDIFASNKIEEINPIGEPFNPELHNAVMQEETDDKEMDEKITAVFQKGYKKDSKVLRYAQVKVAKA